MEYSKAKQSARIVVRNRRGNGAKTNQAPRQLVLPRDSSDVEFVLADKACTNYGQCPFLPLCQKKVDNSLWQNIGLGL